MKKSLIALLAQTNCWIADRVVYRIDRIKGKKIYVVVKHLA